MLRSATAIALLGLAMAAPSAAERPEPQRHGEWCPRAGCTPRPGSSAGYAAGFAVAVLGAAALRHRRSAPNR